jgi:hypothetical protein
MYGINNKVAKTNYINMTPFEYNWDFAYMTKQ